MAHTWKKGQFPGIRFREHPTRKNQGKPDRYYTIRFTLHGQLMEEAIGWASQGWNDKKALARLAALKESHRTGSGPATLREARKEAQEKAEVERRAGITFGQFWRETYFPQCKEEKTRRTWQREASFYRKWLEPRLAQKPLLKIAPVNLEGLKREMMKAELTSRSIQYALAVVRQVFNLAGRMGQFIGDPPTAQVKAPKPKRDNRRLRFLSQEEAHRLLKGLKGVSHDTADMALLSLHTGMRAGEIFNLTWGDVDLKRGLATLRDTKNRSTRHAYLTKPAKAMLQARGPGESSALVFPARAGGRRHQISKSFGVTVNNLGLNDGVKDARDKVVFHTLRHTFASWLVMEGTPLYTVGKLLGHKTSQMTERYSHLAPNHMQEAVKALEGAFAGESAKEAQA